MESKVKANLMIFLTIAILALSVASVCESMTGSVMDPYLTKFVPHKTDKLGVIADGNFSPEQIKTVEINVISPPVNDTNITKNNTTTTKVYENVNEDIVNNTTDDGYDGYDGYDGHDNYDYGYVTTSYYNN